mmetsp:Transcript_10546/g.29067  ORF Transcript_10546/g.29067 Transcript_10546/m.29067 type:complete len:283 (+) Transcript_10546:1634-2482(+)
MDLMSFAAVTALVSCCWYEFARGTSTNSRPCNWKIHRRTVGGHKMPNVTNPNPSQIGTMISAMLPRHKIESCIEYHSCEDGTPIVSHSHMLSIAVQYCCMQDGCFQTVGRRGIICRKRSLDSQYASKVIWCLCSVLNSTAMVAKTEQQTQMTTTVEIAITAMEPVEAVAPAVAVCTFHNGCSSKRLYDAVNASSSSHVFRMSASFVPSMQSICGSVKIIWDAATTMIPAVMRGHTNALRAMYKAMYPYTAISCHQRIRYPTRLRYNIPVVQVDSCTMASSSN